MAEVRWIKITTDMFSNRKIRHLRKLPDGNNIVLIWVMLLTMAGRCNASGMIFLTENIPYTPKMLADELDFEESTVVLALQALEQLNMIVTDNGYFAIAGWEEYQNIAGMDKIREQNRLRKAAQRSRQKELPEVSRDSHVTVTQCHATDKDIDKEEDIDIEKDNKSVRENTRTLFLRLLPDYVLSVEAKAKMEEWITYKMERREPYKEQGMKSLLRQVENNCHQYGERAVCELIDNSMANGWKGIMFDKLKAKAGKPYQKPTKADELNEFYRMAADWSENP
jgi:predicted phage replisome organizer